MGVDLWELRAKRIGENLFMFRVHPRDFTQSECLQICQKLVDALNRWPDVSKLTSKIAQVCDIPATRALFVLVVRNLFPDKPIRSGTPALTHEPNSRLKIKYSFVTVLPRIDPLTWGVQYWKWKQNVDNLPDVSIPSADNLKVLFGHREHNDSLNMSTANRDVPVIEVKVPEGLDPETAFKLRRTDAFMRLSAATWMRNGSIVCSNTTTNAFKTTMFSRFAPSSSIDRCHRLYPGEMQFSRLFGMEERPNHRLIIPGCRVEKDVPGIPAFVVGSKDRTWTEPIGDAAIRA